MIKNILENIRSNRLFKKITFILCLFVFGITFYLLMLPALATTDLQDLPIDDNYYSFTVHQANTYKLGGKGTILAYGKRENLTIYEALNKSTTNTFRTWTVIFVENISGEYVVKDKLTTVTEDENELKLLSDYVKNKSKLIVPYNGFAFLVWDQHVDFKRATEIAVGSTVTLNLTGTIDEVNSNQNGVGTITFEPPSVKDSKDYTFNTIETVDTSDLIEMNLFNYNVNINDMYYNDNYYPGFVQSAGSRFVYTLDKVGSYSFGNIITVDMSKRLSSINTVGINRRNPDNANNRPLSGEMYSTLKDGYPALANGNSLKYLFTENNGSTKVNTGNVTHLFQQDETTGAYYFNSRETHAQFNASDNTFTVYNHLITPNYLIYPFGNFLPFNNIETQTTKTPSMNSEYFKKISSSAMYKYLSNSIEDYKKVSNILNEFDYIMTQKHGKDWTAGEAATGYFSAAGIGATIDNSNLSNLYTIDYDEPVDFHFGMNMKMEFMQPKDGKTGKSGNEDMVFYFNGDDDVWVYIDGVKFLDLSGMHRHVGGEIDFVNGLVKYYDLDVSIGDVTATPQKVETFADILGSTSGLNSKGTFENYSKHDFEFYYMERGSGSSVMKLVFNMPLLRKNSISISKDVEIENNEQLLGNQEYLFQVLDPNGNVPASNDPLFINNTTYSVYDDFGNKINDNLLNIGEDGIIKIKSGEHAVISNIDENRGTYYIRELLPAEYYSQYKKVIVDDKEFVSDSYINIELFDKSYYVINSDIKDISNNSNTTFAYKNIVDKSKLGQLRIEKKLGDNTSSTSKLFEMYVKIDGVLIPVGTKYEVDGEMFTVETLGIVKVSAGKEAIIKNILAGSKFNVKENNPFTSGYDVSYTSDSDVVINSDGVSGTIKIQSNIGMVVINSERSNEIEIPVRKVLDDTDKGNYTYEFNLYKVDNDVETFVDSINIQVGESGISEGKFVLKYLQPEHQTQETIYKYRIKEKSVSSDLYGRYDDSIYEIEVTVLNKSEGVFTSTITSVKKNNNVVGDVEFTNAILSSLTITKIVESKTPTQEGKFIFEIISNDLKNKDFKALINGNSDVIEFNENGVAEVRLAHNETATIYGIDKNTKLQINEKNSDGFAVMYKVNSNGYVEGNSISDLILDSKENNIEFKNMKGYILPDTGSNIELILLIIGTLLVSVTIIYIRYIFIVKKEVA